MGANILIVEDEEPLTTLLRYNLEAEGYGEYTKLFDGGATKEEVAS